MRGITLIFNIGKYGNIAHLYKNLRIIGKSFHTHIVNYFQTVHMTGAVKLRTSQKIGI